MSLSSEPKIHQSTCSYCGDAAVNHKLLFVENFIASHIDSSMIRTTQYAPQFLKDFASWLPVFLFRGLVALKMARFSDDIEKVSSFRSKVIWEEAKKRNIKMHQVILGKKSLEWYRARLGKKIIYFESLPIQPEYLDFKKDWDNKIVLKKELSKHAIPVPQYAMLSKVSNRVIQSIYNQFTKPVIIKPQLGSRGRHTITNIKTFSDFKKGITIAGQISSHLVVEEHLQGNVCRATLVGFKLAGFYKGKAPSIVGDGIHTIYELIQQKDKDRHARVMPIRTGEELDATLARAGFTMEDILPKDEELVLSHRNGRLFGGTTKEMIDELHPSFIPILEKASKLVGLSVVGFDCIIPDPTQDESTQRWGIIECNTLPFIDLHYYALEGKPRNIAGMIWDLWNEPSEQQQDQ